MATSGSEPELPSQATLSPDEKYAYLADYGTQILCLFHADTGCSYLSKNFESITGQEISHCAGGGFWEILHPDFHARFKELLNRPAQRHKPHPFRCKLLHADEKYYWYHVAIHTHAKHSLAEAVCIMENIHDEILIQNNLQKAKLEAELALRARSEFLANMSHDLRTPLNAVIGFSQIIESEMFGKIENPQYLEYVKHIQESGYDLLSKIEDLLEIASIDAGRMVLDKQEVYLSDILKHVIEAQTHHASPLQVQLAYQPPKSDLLLSVDRVKMQHILGHLINNALKFSPQGATVSVSTQPAADGGLEIIVRDQGIGMPKNKLDAILFALDQEGGWTAKNNKVIGLGLALAKEFVSLHGGNLHLESVPGKGTIVYVRLPKVCLALASEPLPDYPKYVAV